MQKLACKGNLCDALSKISESDTDYAYRLHGSYFIYSSMPLCLIRFSCSVVEISKRSEKNLLPPTLPLPTFTSSIRLSDSSRNPSPTHVTGMSRKFAAPVYLLTIYTFLENIFESEPEIVGVSNAVGAIQNKSIVSCDRRLEAESFDHGTEDGTSLSMYCEKAN